MTAELWLEKRCVHGLIGCGELICAHDGGEHPKDEHGTISACMCSGGSRVRLAPDKVVMRSPWDDENNLTAGDIIDALEEE